MKCSTKHCNNELGLIYLGKPLCWSCWHNRCRREERNLEPIRKSEDLRCFV